MGVGDVDLVQVPLAGNDLVGAVMELALHKVDVVDREHAQHVSHRALRDLFALDGDVVRTVHRADRVFYALSEQFVVVEVQIQMIEDVLEFRLVRGVLTDGRTMVCRILFAVIIYFPFSFCRGWVQRLQGSGFIFCA